MLYVYMSTPSHVFASSCLHTSAMDPVSCGGGEGSRARAPYIGIWQVGPLVILDMYSAVFCFALVVVLYAQKDLY